LGRCKEFYFMKIYVGVFSLARFFVRPLKSHFSGTSVTSEWVPSVRSKNLCAEFLCHNIQRDF